ncbi:MAG: lysophospholipid acyltransferase family protein [Candidatus Binatia bacterium]
MRRRARAILAALDWLRYRGAEYSCRCFVRALPWMPERSVNFLASALSRFTFAILWKYRSRMEQNLALALGEELPSREQRQEVIRRVWRNFAQGVLETLPLLHSPKNEKVIASVAIAGEEHLKRALAKGKGVIALSAHLGNFMMIGIRLAAAGYAFSALIKQPRDPRFARLWDYYRSNVGIATISAKPRREAVRGILKALRANRIVLVIADEFKSGGVPVEFFGLRSPAPRGPATLALRTGAATVPMFMIRDSHDRLTLYIEPEIELTKTGDLEQDTAANTVLFTRHLEAMIRRHPDQWNWIGFQRIGIRPRSRRRAPRIAGRPTGT